MGIGDRVKTLRLQQRLTLAQLSRNAGVSKSMLSRIEGNHSSPTIPTLQKIASALGVSLAALADGLDEQATSSDEPRTVETAIVRHGQRKKLIMPWGATYDMLCPDMQHGIEFIAMNYPVGVGSDALYSHAGEECGVVLEGRLKGVVGDEEFILEPGDSVYYASSVPHRWENVGDVEARAVWAVTPPSF